MQTGRRKAIGTMVTVSLGRRLAEGPVSWRPLNERITRDDLQKPVYSIAPMNRMSVLKKELLAHLRSRRIMRRGRTATTAGQTRGQIIGAISIRDRPAEIEDRAVPGHWPYGDASIAYRLTGGRFAQRFQEQPHCHFG